MDKPPPLRTTFTSQADEDAYMLEALYWLYAKDNRAILAKLREDVGLESGIPEKDADLIKELIRHGLLKVIKEGDNYSVVPVSRLH